MSSKVFLAAIVLAAASVAGPALAEHRGRDFNAMWIDEGFSLPRTSHCHVGRNGPDCEPQAGVYHDNKHIVFEGG